MQLMRHFWNAGVALDPAARDKDEGRPLPAVRTRSHAPALGGRGFPEGRGPPPSESRPLFRDFDDYWTPFLSGQAPAPGYCMSAFRRRTRARLRDRVRESLPYAIDGSIPMAAPVHGRCAGDANGRAAGSSER
jgi:hypothetical protein